MLSGDWIAGFCDGESWFTLMIAPSKSTRTGFNVAPKFRIQLHKSDKSVLDQIQECLGVGRVQPQSYNGRDASLFSVAALKECVQVREFFNQHPLQSKKRDAFEAWSKGLDIIASKRHLTKEGILELAKLRDKMNMASTRHHLGKRRYRDYEYFRARLCDGNYQLVLTS